MEENDLPIVVRCHKLFLEPPDLLRLGVSVLEREEADVRLRAERVVELPSHGKQLVEAPQPVSSSEADPLSESEGISSLLPRCRVYALPFSTTRQASRDP